MPQDNLVNEALLWTQPRILHEEYQLQHGDKVVGTLRFRSSLGSFATAENSAGSWTFKRLGFLQTRVTVRVAGADADLATFRNNTWSGGGTLDLPDGRHFKAATNFWQTRYEILDATDQPLLRYRMEGLLRMSGHMDVLVPAPELPWLMMLGWYLAVMMHRDSAAVAV